MTILSQVAAPQDWPTDEPESGGNPVRQRRAELIAESAAIRERTRARHAARGRICLTCGLPNSEPRDEHSACGYDPSGYDAPPH